MLRKTRSEIMRDFKEQVAQGKILVGVGAGTGITAKCSEKADVDMLIIYNSGRFRMAGLQITLKRNASSATAERLFHF